MPLPMQSISKLDLVSIKSALENISRNAFKLTNPGGVEGRLYMDSDPTTADIEEGSAVFSFVGGVYKLNFKINGLIKSVIIG